MPNPITASTAIIPITILITDTRDTGTTPRGDAMSTFELIGLLIADLRATGLRSGATIHICLDIKRVTPIHPEPSANRPAHGLAMSKRPLPLQVSKADSATARP